MLCLIGISFEATRRLIFCLGLESGLEVCWKARRHVQKVRLISGPDEREGLPALHVESRDGGTWLLFVACVSGHVEVVEVKNIEGLASAWKEHHLFDLSFKVLHLLTLIESCRGGIQSLLAFGLCFDVHGWLCYHGLHQQSAARRGQVRQL